MSHTDGVLSFASAIVVQTILEDVILRPESFSGEILLHTRRRLGVSEVVAGGMHLDIYQSAIQVAAVKRNYDRWVWYGLGTYKSLLSSVPDLRRDGFAVRDTTEYLVTSFRGASRSCHTKKMKAVRQTNARLHSVAALIFFLSAAGSAGHPRQT